MYKPTNNRYDNIPYNRCGDSGLLLPAISLGLWQNFGDESDYNNAKEMVFKAFDLGITHFDLANNYGPSPGSAERNFGKILKEDLAGYRDHIIVSSKAGYDMWEGPYGEWGSKKHLISSIDQSLNRLKLDYVDIFYSHRPDPNTPMEETMAALDLIVRQGKALYVGISSYSPEQTKEASVILDRLGTPCIIHQAKYNLFERWIEEGLTKVLKEKKMGAIAFTPLAQGILSDKYLHGIPESSRAAKNASLKQEEVESYVKKAQTLNIIAKERGQSLAQMAIAWILRLPEITSVLIGTSSVQQIEENVAALKNADFSIEDLTRIERILKT